MWSRYLCGEMRWSDHKRKNVVSALTQEITSRGIKNVELAELTGWSTAKVSKLLSGRQAFTDDDFRVCARALGYTLDPFVDQAVDTRGYDVTEFVRKPVECLDNFLDVDEEDDEYASIINVELPLSILGLLGVRVYDYAVRTHVSSGYNGNEEENCSWIKIWNRNTRTQEDPYPVLSLWIDAARDVFSVLVYLEGAKGNQPYGIAELREMVHSANNEYDFLMKEDSDNHWLPGRVLDNVLSFDYWDGGNILPDEGYFQDILAGIFKDYCDIVWELRHMDLIPYAAIFSSQTTPIRKTLLKSLAEDSSFSEKTVRETLSAREYRCEIDASHQTFETADGHQYAEAVPLIPFEDGVGQGKGVMESANVLCLCPNCAARLRHGTNEDREEMVIKLYRSHRKELENVGIRTTLGEILKMYKL